MTGRHPHFGPLEFSDRLARVRQKLNTLGVDAALFDEIELMSWIAGYGNSENRWRCVVVPTSSAREPFFLIRALDAGPCRKRSWIADVPTYRDWEDPFALLANKLAERRLEKGRIGLDFNSYGMPIGKFDRMKNAMPHVQWVDLGPLVWELRLLKSRTEIGLLEQAAAIADETMLRVARACNEGASQRDAARVAVASYVELGADPGPPGPIAAGRGWDFLHAQLESGPLAGGDVVHVELVPSVGGYSARLMRCVPVGAPHADLVKVAEVLEEIQSRQIAAMRPGARARDIDAILRDGIVGAGLRETVDHITGYTLGLYAPAGPRTSDFTRMFCPTSEWLLETGMVFHMYASAAGVSFSETVLVTDDGSRRLTQLPRKLMVGV